MCGIVAFLNLQRQNRDHHSPQRPDHVSSVLDKSLDLIEHRGPDARGQWINSTNTVGLGHVRLSITDLSPTGNQPFHHEEDGIHAVVNGELYGYESYREALSSEYQFQGNSDCEIVIALYRHYGLNFLSHLRGEFAIVLWDAKREVLLAARDRFGVKSLYWTVVEGRLIVATEMKSFLAFGWTPEWSVESIKEQGWQFDDRTFFQGVYKVMPGRYMISRNFGTLKQDRYWIPSYPDKTAVETRSELEMILGVRERLLEATKIRLRSDMPLGVYLSGGIDSSAIAGMIKHLMKEIPRSEAGDPAKLKCFTVQFAEDSGVDESAIARRTAEWLGVDFNPVVMSEELIASGFEDAVWYSESVFPDVNGVCKMTMAELAHSKGIKVVITGEGSDEHFGGYFDLVSEIVKEQDHSWPNQSAVVPDDLKQSIWEKYNAWVETAWVSDKDTAAPPPTSTRRMLNNSSLSQMLTKVSRPPLAAWTEKIPTSHPETVLAESLDGCIRDAVSRKWHPFHTAEYLWTQTFLPNFILRWVGDNVDMVHHVESRPPFLDHHVTEYANNLPPSIKYKGNKNDGAFTEKYVLREAMKPFITMELYERRKKGFLGPTRWKRGGPFEKLLKNLITERIISQLGFVDWEKAKDSLERAFESDDSFSYKRAVTVAQFVVLMRKFGVKTAGSFPT